jgi:hypothetical protein
MVSASAARRLSEIIDVNGDLRLIFRNPPHLLVGFLLSQDLISWTGSLGVVEQLVTISRLND